MHVYNPRPTPGNVITHGNARFTLLTGRMLRLEWAADGHFEDRATLAVVNRALPPVRRRAAVSGRKLTVTAPGFTLTYVDDGRPFSARNLSVTFRQRRRARVWRPGMRNPQNLGATLRTLDGIKGGRRQEWKKLRSGKWVPTKKWVPVDMGAGLVSRAGWALVDDSRGIILDGDPGWVTRGGRRRQSGGARRW